MMNISSSWNALTGRETCRLQIDVTGNSPADALRMVLEEGKRAAKAAGGPAHEQWHAWTVGWRNYAEQAEKLAASLHVTNDRLRSDLAEAIAKRDEALIDLSNARRELDDARSGRAKAQDRRERWRKRAETAGELAASMQAQRDEARAEVARLRAELKQARTISATPTPGVEPIGQPPIVTLPVRRPNPTPTPAPKITDLLAAILAAVEAIRDDLASQGPIR